MSSTVDVVVAVTGATQGIATAGHGVLIVSATGQAI